MVRVKPRYDHYENNMFLDDPIAADNTRRPAALSPKIGCEGRMGKPVDIHEERPGPQNYSPTKLGLKNAAHYSFGYRRSGVVNDVLKLSMGTPQGIGPGKYKANDE
jgi:hypothetical protein